ncbi:hypothetical protein [Pararhizobium sp. A13]|uniref:hypothetical protein n=1 Tax=Pararhizobium sp. A13 TaxID=3133975 RepID=UPI00324FB7A4
MSKDITGPDERPTIRKLIDKYIPVHTQDAVWQMIRVHEAEVYDLLYRLHQLQENHNALCKHVEKLHKEVSDRETIRVPLGKFTVEGERMMMEPSFGFRAIWRPDPLHYAVILPHDPLDPRLSPEIFHVVVDQFRDRFAKEAAEKVTAEFIKLYHTVVTRR